jgi:hypothetical protein
MSIELLPHFSHRSYLQDKPSKRHPDGPSTFAFHGRGCQILLGNPANKMLVVTVLRIRLADNHEHNTIYRYTYALRQSSKRSSYPFHRPCLTLPQLSAIPVSDSRVQHMM